MRSKRVAWSTLTNSASQDLRSLSSEAPAEAEAEEEASEWRLQYSMTLERILLVTLGKGMALSSETSSTMCFIVCDCSATASSTSKDSPSELRSTIFFDDDVDILENDKLLFTTTEETTPLGPRPSLSLELFCALKE